MNFPPFLKLNLTLNHPLKKRKKTNKEKINDQVNLHGFLKKERKRKISVTGY
jgi:hypothetical protein